MKMNRFTLENKETIMIISIGIILALLVSLCGTGVLEFASNDTETAGRIFDGVGVEGLSAIFAIVISLSLMAVGFASQKYTHRIMKIHIKSLTFWAVIVIYLGSMFYNVFMLGRLDMSVDVKVDYRYVEISMLLTFLCFIIIIPYFFITMARLRPEPVISNLLANIDDDYLNSIKGYIKEGEPRVPIKADKVLPVRDIIEKSIGSGDRETARFGIDEIYRCYKRLLKEENEVYVSPYFLKHILRIGREAIIEADDDSMAQVLETFGMTGEHAIDENWTVSARRSLEYIEIIGSNVLKDYDVATEQMIASLHGMLRMIIKNGYLFSMDSVPGDDDEKLKEFLKDDFDIDWTENAEILKSDDGKTISIRKDENSAKIIVDAKKEKATLKITDGRTHELKVKTENGKLIIYKREDKETLGEIFTLYDDIADKLYTLENYQMLKYMGNSVSELLDSMMETRCYDVIEGTAGLLERIALFAVKLEIRDLLHQSVHSLYKMGISSAKDKLVWGTPKRTGAERIIDRLLKIEEETLKYKSRTKEFDLIITEIEYARKDIERYSEEKEEKDVSDGLWD